MSKEKLTNNSKKEKIVLWLKLTYWFIILFGVTFIVSAAVNIGMKASKSIDESGTEKTKDIKVSEEVVEKLLRINGVYYDDILTQVILYNTEGIINDKLSASDKSLLVYYYAKNNEMLTDIVNDVNSYCTIEEPCKGISYSDFINIERIYGITNDPIMLFPKERMYNGYYLYKSTDIETGNMLEQTDFTAEYFGNDIILKGTIKVHNLETNDIEEKTISYTFKLNSSNEYYLYSVNSK